MIYEFLNVRHSTRNLSDEDFEKSVEQLASELAEIDFRASYTDTQLQADWMALKNFNSSRDTTSSTTRVGLKLCEQFFPNFYDIKNSRGQSFSSSWNKDNLIKILRWNRKSHSTPYLSEIKRGIYFCTGLTKNTMYRPHLAKSIISSFPGNTVLDPCAGWGGRMLGTVAAGKKYIGFETNKETYNNLLKLADYLNIKNDVELYNIGSEHLDLVIKQNVDIVLTSPPYFNLEIYSDGETQSENKFKTYEEWRDNWLADVIKKCLSKLADDGVSC